MNTVVPLSHASLEILYKELAPKVHADASVEVLEDYLTLHRIFTKQEAPQEAPQGASQQSNKFVGFIEFSASEMSSVEIIKIIRALTGKTLKEAKDYYDENNTRLDTSLINEDHARGYIDGHGRTSLVATWEGAEYRSLVALVRDVTSRQHRE